MSAESKEHAMPTRNEIAMLDAAREAGITSRDELANFMGQLSHESGGFRTLAESFRSTRGIDQIPESGRAHVRTTVTNAHIVCRSLLETTKNTHTNCHHLTHA